jgi:hypothetical protein
MDPRFSLYLPTAVHHSVLAVFIRLNSEAPRMGMILVTGFQPYSPLTRACGNPSQKITEQLGQEAGTMPIVMKADPSCFAQVDALGRLPVDVTAVLMMGAEMYLSEAVVLELEGVTERGKRRPSFAAARLAEFAKGIGARVDSPDVFTRRSLCLRSYGAALEWTDKQNIPCIFLHLNPNPLHLRRQVVVAQEFLERLRAGLGR